MMDSMCGLGELHSLGNAHGQNRKVASQNLMLLQATLHPSTWMETSQSGNYVSTLTPNTFYLRLYFKVFSYSPIVILHGIVSFFT